MRREQQLRAEISVISNRKFVPANHKKWAIRKIELPQIFHATRYVKIWFTARRGLETRSPSFKARKSEWKPLHSIRDIHDDAIFFTAIRVLFFFFLCNLNFVIPVRFDNNIPNLQEKIKKPKDSGSRSKWPHHDWMAFRYRRLVITGATLIFRVF